MADSNDEGRIPASILLVEDNPADVSLVRMALEEHDVVGELTVLVDGEKALRLIQSVNAGTAECPDLVIIDLSLPRVPGRVVLEELRRSATCGSVPVIILSSSEALPDRDDAARLGANRYFRKPSRLDDFLALGAVFRAELNR